MSTYHIGGIRLSTYRKDDVDMFIRDKSIGGDLFLLHRHKTLFTKGVFVTNSLYIQGDSEEKTIITIPKGMTGFLLQQGGSLHLSNLTIRVSNQASAIYADETCRGNIVLKNVTIEYEDEYDTREKYALVSVAPVQEDNGYTFNPTSVSLENVQLDSCFLVTNKLMVTDSVLSDVFNGLMSSIETKMLTFDNSHLNNIRLVYCGHDVATLNNLSINYNVSLHGLITVPNPSIEMVNGYDNKNTARKINKAVNNMDQGLFILLDAPYGNHPSHVEIINPEFDDELYNNETPFPIGWFNLIGSNSDDVKTEWVFKMAKIPPSATGSIASNVDILLESTRDKENWRIGKVNVQAVTSSTNLPLSSKDSSSDNSNSNKPDALTELNALTGLGNVKKTIQKTVALAEMNKVRRQKNLAETRGVSLHSVFAGPAGTGKTTVARLYAQALFERGVIRKNTIIEATSKDLVSGYVGQTADKTHKVVESALGGVLFIDEAYSLAPQPGTTSFNDEAVAQLIADIENHRDDLVVILAGYSDEMKDFILNGNPGLQSRFTNWVTFDAYSESELQMIFKDLLKRENTYPSDENANRQANESLLRVFKIMSDADEASTGNGRFVRNFVQEVMLAKDVRLATGIGDLNALDETELTTFIVDDVVEAERILLDRHHTLRN